MLVIYFKRKIFFWKNYRSVIAKLNCVMNELREVIVDRGDELEALKEREMVVQAELDLAVTTHNNINEALKL